MVETAAEGPGRADGRERIVEAAAHLLRDGGRAAVTTRAVAQAAGVQAPAIYRLFGDKDGLLDAVAEHEMGRYVDAKALAVETGDPVADLRAAWERNIAFGLDNPDLFGLIADPARLARSPAAAAGQSVLAARVHRVAGAGRLRVSEQRAVELIRAAGTGAILTLLGSAAEDRDPLLAVTLFDAVMQAVLADPPADGADPVATAAVTLRSAAPDLPALSPAERTLMAEWLDRVAGS